MALFGKLLAVTGLILLLAAWQLDLIYALFGLQEQLVEEGGTLHYNFHLEKNRMIGLSVGSASLILGSILYLGARIIARNEAGRDQQSL